MRKPLVPQASLWILIRSVWIGLCLVWVGSWGAVRGQELPLGSIGGRGELVPGTGLIRVVSLADGSPGEMAGLLVGDQIFGADGRAFGETPTSAGAGYVGAIQDLAMALDRAEGGSGSVSLQVIRGGVGGVDLTVTVGAVGSLGPAWPAGSAKADANYEWCCAKIHSRVQSSSDANFRYNSGWFGLILLSHPGWDDTTGSTPYRLSIDQLRVRCESYLNGRVLEPAEAYYWDGSDVIANPAYVSAGLENWDVCSSAMFLALYRSKTGDVTADAVVQRAAEMIAHRIQSWNQYDDPAEPHVLGGGLGRMGHGGVHGDYSHYNGTGALNIINAHALPAMALLKNAGANMNLNLGLSINSFSYDTAKLTPSIEGKFRICWDFVKAATRSDGGGDDGNVGYVGVQSGWDSAGRTPGCFAGWHLYGLAPVGDDLDKVARQSDYISRRWYRQQHAHAYTLGGVALSQLAMAFMDDRGERFFQENTRLYPALARQPDGSMVYFPGRQNNGGDSYLNKTNVGLINAAIPTAIRSATLPGFPAPNPDRLHAWMRSPVNSWPVLEARQATLRGGLSHLLDLDIVDVDGVVLAPGSYTASWSQVSGPGTVVFGSPGAADTTVSFPQAGSYRVELEVVRNGYILTEPYDLLVDTSPVPEGVVPYVVTEPAGQSANQGNAVSFTVDAQGTGPLLYQWRLGGVPIGSNSVTPELMIESVSAGSAGDYDCVITNAYGTVTSASATLTVNGVGSFSWGGLWRDVFVGISGGRVSDLTGAPNYPGFPDASGVINQAESPSGYADNYGQRWSGWITPPESGDYRFYSATDDASELWLSTTDQRSDRILIATESTYRGVRNWSTNFSNESVSSPIALVGGQRYYIELLHKEGGGGDNAAVTWDWRSAGTWTTPLVGSDPLPGAVLEYQVGGTIDDQARPPTDYPPVAEEQNVLIYGGVPTPITLLGEDFEKASLSYVITVNPSQGVLSGTPPNLLYTPNGGSSGTDSFGFRVNDGVQDSFEATVTISLIPESGGDLKVWSGASDVLWPAGTNWVAGNSPDANDAVVFDTSSIANLSTVLNGDRAISRVVIEDAIGPVSISGNTLMLADGIEMRPALVDLTISSSVELGANQEWAVGADRTLTLSGDLSGSSGLTKSGPGILNLQAVGTLTGPVTVEEGTVELNGGGWYKGYVAGSGMLTVREGGTVINVKSHSFGSSNNSSRSFTVDGGRFRLQKETYFNDVFLTAGRIDNTPGSTADLRARTGNNTVVTVHAAELSSVIACPFNLTGTALFDVADGGAEVDLLVSGALRGAAALSKDGDGRMTLSGLNVHTGTIAVNLGRLAVTGSLDPASAVTVQGGSILEGTGSIQGSVTNRGLIGPGVEGIAVLNLGSFVQDSAGVTAVELAGAAPGSGHDQLVIAGAASLAGTLDVTLAEGFVPAIGDELLVLRCGSRSGNYGTINFPALPEDREWQATYDPGGDPGLALSVVEVNPYRDWAVLHFGPEAGDPGIGGELADPEGDDIKNLIEYGLNLDPLAPPMAGGVSGHEGVPVGEMGLYEFFLIYRRNLAATDVAFTVEQSLDLGNPEAWGTAVVTETILSDDGQTQVIRAAVSTVGIRDLYLRLKMEK